MVPAPPLDGPLTHPIHHYLHRVATHVVGSLRCLTLLPLSLLMGGFLTICLGPINLISLCCAHRVSYFVMVLMYATSGHKSHDTSVKASISIMDISVVIMRP